MRKLILTGASCFAVGAGGMALLNQAAIARTAPNADTYRMLELFGDVLSTVQDHYVVKVDDKKLIEAAIDGMLTSLDPHSGYLNLEGFDELRDSSRGEYGGLGLEVTAEEGLIKVIAPMDGTPAARAGVKAGDYITAINDESVVGLGLSQSVKQMRGAPGSSIKITIAREGEEEPIDLHLKREVIAVQVVKARVEGDYGVLRISQFNEETGRQTEAAVRRLLQQKPDMKGLVLDLRNNPGGLLDESVEVADVFLDGGEVVSQRGRNPRDIVRYNAKPGDVLAGKPMVVLINYGSASASEIVAGALQDRRRASIVGLTSFGKGSVQTVIPLRNGLDGALKLTTDRYFTPSGRSIQRTGIEPDLEVARDEREAKYVMRVSSRGEAGYRNALDAQEGKARKAAHEPAEIPPASFDTKAKDADFQLARAFDVLKYGSVRAVPKLPTLKVAGPAKLPITPATAPAANRN
ncbi:MAG: S41 family peptidase [Pseudomonadota bacterium]|nr:S41 family peptidase [Pseudomonadota bacterium]